MIFSKLIPLCFLMRAALVVSDESDTVPVKLRVTATVGDRVTLPCVSQNRLIKEVDWTYRKTTSAADVNVWNRKWLVNGYKSCCTIETIAAGMYNLVIYQVTRNHTGFYDCVERSGFGKRHRIRLDVLAPVMTTPQSHSSHTSRSATDTCLWSPINLTVLLLVNVPTLIFTGIIFFAWKKEKGGRRTNGSQNDIEQGEASMPMKATESDESDERHYVNVELDKEISIRLNEIDERIKESRELRSKVKKAKSKRIKFGEASYTSDLEIYFEQVIQTLTSSKSAITNFRPTEEDNEKPPVVVHAVSNAVTHSATNDYVDQPVI